MVRSTAELIPGSPQATGWTAEEINPRAHSKSISTCLCFLLVEFPPDLLNLRLHSFSKRSKLVSHEVRKIHSDPHVSLDQSQSLVHVRFRFLLVLFYQNRADKFVDFVFRSQLSEFLGGILSVSSLRQPATDPAYLLDHLVLL